MELKKLIVRPDIEGLNLTKKESETTDSMGSRNSNRINEMIFSGDDNSSGKQSIKKQKSVF